jgi:hypothetical protein
MRQLRTIGYALICILTLASPGLSRDRDWDSVPPRHHRIQIDPISFLTGSLNAHYEFRFNRHHALAIEGFYTLPLLGVEGQVVGGMYRYYYKQNTFLGLFMNNGEVISKLPPERGDTTTYTYSIEYLIIGPNWGKSWYLNNRFPLTLRIGAGYPAISRFAWKNGLKYPTMPSLFENLARFSACLDTELSIGISF